MEDKFLFLENLRNKKGFGIFSQNVSSGSEQKNLVQNSNNETTDKHVQSKTKNALELPRSATRFFKLFKNLHAGCQSFASVSRLKDKREGSPSKKTCEKMNTSQPDIPLKSNNTGSGTSHSLETNHSKGDAHFNSESKNSRSGGKEKTDDEFHNNRAENIQEKGNKPALKKIKSENEDFGSFEEVFDSSESDDVNNDIVVAPVHSIKNIPAKVQDWINHLPHKNSCQRPCIEIETKDEEPENVVNEGTSLLPAKLSRDESLQSSSSLDSLLDARRPDPVEIFLNLGFGGVPGVDMEICRIPKRFLVPSKCKGGDWNEFLKREFIQAQNFECSSLGFRGLSGPSYRRPSAIVANIMEKLRERSISQPYANKSRFAKKLSTEKGLDNKLSPEFQSVLSPDNRKFLQNQGKISPEVPRRRIIFGQKSFAFGRDGEFVEVESSNAKNVAESPKEVPTELTGGGRGENGIGPRTEDQVPENLSKYRRGSLQKQKKITDDDFEADPGFYGVGKVEKKAEDSSRGDAGSLTPCKKSASDGGSKIPRRFLSSSNLKPGSDANLSEMMRREVEKEIRSLSQKIRDISDQELVSVLRQVKELSSALESSGHVSFEL